jgi:hypothetical protein
MIANLRKGVSVCRHHDIGNQQQDCGRTRDERASRREPDYATERWKYQPRERCMVERVVRPDCAGNLGDVVVSLKKTFIIVIEGLFCTMSWDGRGKLHLQPLPGLAVFFMWPNLADVDTRLCEQKRRCEVIPITIAREVEQMQPIPGCREDMADERRTGSARSSTTRPSRSSIHTRVGVKWPR